MRSCCGVICLGMLAGCAMPAAPDPPVAPSWTDKPVSIKSTPPELTTRRFPAGRPPAAMPPLKPGDAAVCETHHDSTAVVHAQVVAAEADGQRVELKVMAVELTVGLRSILWLPDNATPRLTQHMSGHHRIDEALYERAWSVASRVARRRIGSRHALSGVADSETQAALKAIGDAICLEYMTGVQGVADRIHARYKELTDMGRNDMPSNAALRRAFEEAGVPFDPDALFAAAESAEPD